jgi:hypothetical protein
MSVIIRGNTPLAASGPEIVVPSVTRRRGGLFTYPILKERCNKMFTEETIDTLAIKLERIHVLADLLLPLLVGNPQAQVLSEIILETSSLPEA